MCLPIAGGFSVGVMTVNKIKYTCKYHNKAKRILILHYYFNYY